MKQVPTITDRLYQPAADTLINRMFIRLLRDKRDMPFLNLIIHMSLTLIPLGVALFFPLPPALWWTAALIYIYLSNFKFKSPYGLMLHCISHRRLFRHQYNWLMIHIIWVLGPFIGHTPQTYFSHHMGMHHAENNMPEDESSTMPYQRDSLKDFLRYLGSFLVQGMYNLVTYLKRRNRKQLAKKALEGELSFFFLCAVLLFVNAKATLIVFVLPFLLLRLIMMVGNWTQHSMVDPDDPANPYKNCITTINVKYNHKCWNDGYHSSHHARPALHWSEHPVVFQQTLDTYAANKAIVFDGLDFGAVFLCLITKNYKKLATHLININGTFANEGEAIDVLKLRTRRFSQEDISKLLLPG